MKNTMSVVRIPLQVIVALGLLAILVIEIIRPFTEWPSNIMGPFDEKGTPYAIWAPFAAQFAYFTVWTNVLFVFTLMVAWIFRSKVNPYWKNAIATYLMVMFVVFCLIIAPYANWGRSSWLTFMLLWQHLGVVGVGLWWFFTTKTDTKTNLGQSTLITLIVPFLYIIFAVIIYFSLDVAPYNFLNFRNAFNANLPLAWSVILSIAVIIAITLIVIGFNWLFVSINNNWKAASVKRGRKGGRVASRKNRRANTNLVVEEIFVASSKNKVPVKKQRVIKSIIRVRRSSPKKRLNKIKAKKVVKKPNKTLSSNKVSKKDETWTATYHHRNSRTKNKKGDKPEQWEATYHHHHKKEK